MENTLKKISNELISEIENFTNIMINVQEHGANVNQERFIENEHEPLPKQLKRLETF